MIDTNEAFNLFCEKYSEKYKNQKMEPGDTEVAVLNNCVMIVELGEGEEAGKLKISFSGNEPIFIDDNLDMYVEEE